MNRGQVVQTDFTGRSDGSVGKIESEIFANESETVDGSEIRLTT